MASMRSGKTKQNRKEQATSVSEVSIESQAAELFKAAAEMAPSIHALPKMNELAKVASALEPAARIAFVRATLDLLSQTFEWPASDDSKVFQKKLEIFPAATVVVSAALLKRRLPLTPEDLEFLLDRCGHLGYIWLSGGDCLVALLKHLKRYAEQHVLTDTMALAVRRLADACRDPTAPADHKKFVAELEELGRQTELSNPGAVPGNERAPDSTRPARRARLSPGEAWSDRVMADLAARKSADAANWNALLVHCEKTGGSRPSSKWLATADEHLERIGSAQFRDHVAEWFPLVNKPRTQPVERAEHQPDQNLLIGYTHGDILKGLAWCCSLCGDAAVARAVTSLALSSYRKVPGIGPRLVRVGNACIWSLGEMPGREGLGQLAVLRIRVKFGTAQKVIEKALETTARRLGLPREELEEMSIPAYGLSEVGLRREQLGDCTAEVVIEGSSTQLRWSRAGKPLKSLPASLSKDFGEDVGELKAAVKDIQRMLAAQRERLDSLPLQRKSWPFAVWRGRYLDHPLVGTLARRLIWTLSSGRRRAEVIFLDGRLVDLRDRAVDWPDEETRVELWHPIGRDRDEILAWRAWIEQHEVQQPFKQAHREVYLLTDAERETRVYSNRFAAHILRQHQFSALCALRGWKNKLRLMVDADFPPPARLLPAWGLRAEFWIDSVGEDYGVGTNWGGVFHYISTDQVRFYRVPAGTGTAAPTGETPVPHVTEPLPLDEVPPLVLSEVMRDVDLFVGVSSVGNDPTWRDGGLEGYRDYWDRFAFGSLTESATTRRQVLERLIPRLAIADRCSLADRFLIVRGNLRSYKIHLGSGNILMRPEDKYLCIVKAPSSERSPQVFLPFEGDGTLAVILSKAFLLAADDKITDPTILRQIKVH